MKYGKLENGRLCPSPKAIAKEGKVHYQPSEALLLEYGYLPVIETPCPPSSPDDTAVYAFHYEEHDGALVKVWTDITADGGETEDA